MTNNNFSTEMHLEVNLGPMHLLKPLVSEVFQRWDKVFLYKRNARGALMSQLILTDGEMGVAVRNRRVREENKGRFASRFWAEWNMCINVESVLFCVEAIPFYWFRLY